MAMGMTYRSASSVENNRVKPISKYSAILLAVRNKCHEEDATEWSLGCK
jgi:hypothetical protein